MNFLVSWSLLVMNEQDAFWLLCCIVEDLCPGFYSNTMLGIKGAQGVLEILVQQNLPELSSHMKKINVSLALLCAKWFLLLYLNSLPSEVGGYFDFDFDFDFDFNFDF